MPITVAGLESITYDGKGGDDAVTATGGPAVTLAAGQRLASLSVDGGGRVALAAGSGEAVVTKSLAVGPAGQLDLADGAILVDYDGTSPLVAIRAALLAGRNGGAWTGNGLVGDSAQTSATGTGTIGVGYGTGAQVLGLSGGATSITSPPMIPTVSPRRRMSSTRKSGVSPSFSGVPVASAHFSSVPSMSFEK